jgi:hypothetical protein
MLSVSRASLTAARSSSRPWHASLIAALLLLALVLVSPSAAAVPRSVWQTPSLVAKNLRGLIHPAAGYRFRDVFAKCSGIGPSYYKASEHARVYQRFYCKYVITYATGQSPDDCTGVVVLFGQGGILRARLTDDVCR